MARIKAATFLLFLGVMLFNLGSDIAFGYPPFLKQVQQLGLEAKDCTYCHQTSKGGKGWNERGLWLKDQKKERKAAVVDVKWLKSYTPETGQKCEDKAENKSKE
jgi:hypothetical protein